MSANAFRNWLKDWGEALSPWVTILGIIGAFYAYYEWEVTRGDRAVDFIFKLDDKFNSEEVETGRNLIDWDEEYAGIKAELGYEADPKLDKDEHAQRECALAHTNLLANREFIAYLDDTHKKIQKVDAMLQFFETLNVIRQEKQAPAGWDNSRSDAIVPSARASLWRDKAGTIDTRGCQTVKSVSGLLPIISASLLDNSSTRQVASVAAYN